VTASIDQQLGVIVSQGSPAQVDSAKVLLMELQENPTNVIAANAASALFEAFLHDPHLTRFKD